MSVALDMNSQKYKYFETLNPGGAPQLQSDPHGTDLDHLAQLYVSSPFHDSGLQAHPCWQIYTHLLGFAFLWCFVWMYFNDDAIVFYPIMFFGPLVLSVFICLPIQNIFDSSLMPGVINNISWSFWFGGILSFSAAALFNWIAPLIFENVSPDSEKSNDKFVQYKYVLTALFLTSMFDECVKYYMCRRGFGKYFGLSPPLSQVMNVILYCMAVGMGIGVAKGVIAVVILGNDDPFDDKGLILDYRYGLLDYIIMPWQNIDEHDWKLVCLYSFVMVPFHTVLGGLWGVGFVRRFVLEHYVGFGQMLALPWMFHGLNNIVLAEVYYNADPNFENKFVWLTVTIVCPLVFMLLAMVAVILVFKRRIDPSLHRFNRKVRSSVSSN